MTSISQLPAEEIHRLMTTPGAMRLEDIPLVHLRAAELLKEMDNLQHFVTDLARMYVEFDRLRYEAACLPGDECREFLIMKIPVLQGTRNQIALQRISEQPIDKDKAIAAFASLAKAAMQDRS